MTQPDQVKHLLNQKQALVVGAISDPADLAKLEDPPSSCHILELRLDSLGPGPEVRKFAENSPLPLLITARGPAEGGQNNLSLEERTEAYLALLPFASLIDIELRDFDQLSAVISKARDEKVTIIGSFHNFDHTPPLAELIAKKDSRADLHKFALMVNSTKDISTHLSLIESLGETPFSLMGMGPLGAAARPLMARSGSLLNYGYLGNTPTAPNQWPAGLLAEALAL